MQPAPMWRNLQAQVHRASIEELGLSLNMHCAVCSSLLWGDNYVLGNDEHVADYAVCPLCMHATSKSAPLECKFAHVYCMYFPYTIAAASSTISPPQDLAQVIVPQHKAHILTSMRDRTSIHTIAMGYTTITYALIGDQYAAFTSIDHYLYTSLSTSHTPVEGRVICTMTLVSAGG